MFGDNLNLAPAPAHGEQTTEILGELGYSDEAIDTLIAGGIVQTGEH